MLNVLKIKEVVLSYTKLKLISIMLVSFNETD